MTRGELRNALLLGSCINGIELGSLGLTPRLELPTTNRTELIEVASDLYKDGLVDQFDVTDLIDTEETIISEIPCPLTITPKGRQALNEARFLLGLFNLNINCQFVSDDSILKKDSPIKFEQRKMSTKVDSFRRAIRQHIERSQVSQDEKEEARSRLDKFLAHPLLSAAVSAGLGGLLKTVA